MIRRDTGSLISTEPAPAHRHPLGIGVAPSCRSPPATPPQPRRTRLSPQPVARMPRRSVPRTGRTPRGSIPACGMRQLLVNRVDGASPAQPVSRAIEAPSRTTAIRRTLRLPFARRVGRDHRHRRQRHARGDVDHAPAGSRMCGMMARHRHHTEGVGFEHLTQDGLPGGFECRQRPRRHC